MGLAICKKIVEEHNGEISLYSSKILGGAGVKIIIPNGDRQMTDKPLILIVDDEKDICEQISGILQDNLYETSYCYTSDEALKKISNFPLDLLF